MKKDDEAKRIEKAKTKKIRSQRPFPASSFNEAMEFAKIILEYGSGQPVRYLGDI